MKIPKKLQERGFKGVWIPAWLYFDPDLDATDLIICAEIDSLDNSLEKGCFASDDHFGLLIKKTSGTARNRISSLKKREIIYQCYFDGRNRGLRLNYERWSHEIMRADVMNTLKQVSRLNESRGHEFMNIENNTKKQPERTKENDVNLPKKESVKNEKTLKAKEVISFLNEMADRKFPSEGSRATKNISSVMVMLNKNYTVEELKLIVEFKCFEWKGSEMEKYLTPETLFKRHGDKYHEEAEKAKKDPSFAAMYQKNRAEIDSNGDSNDDLSQALNVLKDL